MPLPLGAAVPVEGRVKGCLSLVEPAERLLDIGCSSGWLAPLVTANGVRHYVGVDRQIVGESLDPRVSFVVGSALALPFDSGSFDAVCLFDVVEHLPRGTEPVCLSEAYRVLKPGGKLYFSTPHASFPHEFLDPVWYAGHRHYRRQTIQRLLVQAGFSIERLFVAGGLVEELNHLRLLAYKHLLRRTLPHVAWVSRLIDRSHEHARKRGMTVFAVARR
jgi:SAM-dependent methyltransferase